MTNLFLSLSRLHALDGQWTAVVDVQNGKIQFRDLHYSPAGQSTKITSGILAGTRRIHIEPCQANAASGDEAFLVRQQIGRNELPRGIANASLVAWEGKGDSILYCGQFSEIINRFPQDTTVLPEAGCLAKAFEFLHLKEIGQRPALHLHVWADALTLFYYGPGGKLLRCEREEVAEKKTEAYQEALRTILRDAQRWMKGLDFLYITGHLDNVDLGSAEWIYDAFQPFSSPQMQMRWGDTTPVASAEPGIGYNEGGGGMPSGIPFVLFGAAKIIESRIGAAFNAYDIVSEQTTGIGNAGKAKVAIEQVGRLVASAAFAAVLGLIVGGGWLLWTSNRLSREAASLKNQIAQAEEKEKELARIRKEATDLIAATKAIRDITKAIQDQEPVQKIPYQVLDLVKSKWVKGMVFRKIEMKGDALTIEGDITVGSVYGTERPGLPPLKRGEKLPPPEELPQVNFDPGQIVAQFADSLKTPVGAFTNIVPNTETASPTKATFKVTCNYNQKLPATPLNVEPFSTLFDQRLKTTTLAPGGATK